MHLKDDLAEGKLLKENIEGDFETYYERWEDEDGTNEDNFLFTLKDSYQIQKI